MKPRICLLLAIAAFVSCFFGSAQTLAQNAYVTNFTTPGTVSVIDTATHAVTGTITVGKFFPGGVAVTPDGRKVYVANRFSSPGTVSVIDTATNTVTATITVGNSPRGVAVTPDGSKVYVANLASRTVSAIATATDTVTDTITGFTAPDAFGVFIIPPDFAGIPGFSNCHGQTVAALGRRFGGLNAATAALGVSGVSGLQNAIMAFCGG